jgi:hypothetical protein
MIRFLRFFYRGPGAILVVLAIALGVAAIIKNGQDKQRAELEKRQAQRELGKVKSFYPIGDLTLGTGRRSLNSRQRTLRKRLRRYHVAHYRNSYHFTRRYHRLPLVRRRNLANQKKRRSGSRAESLSLVR